MKQPSYKKAGDLLSQCSSLPCASLNVMGIKRSEQFMPSKHWWIDKLVECVLMVPGPKPQTEGLEAGSVLASVPQLVSSTAKTRPSAPTASWNTILLEIRDTVAKTSLFLLFPYLFFPHVFLRLYLNMVYISSSKRTHFCFHF